MWHAVRFLIIVIIFLLCVWVSNTVLSVKNHVDTCWHMWCDRHVCQSSKFFVAFQVFFWKKLNVKFSSSIPDALMPNLLHCWLFIFKFSWTIELFVYSVAESEKFVETNFFSFYKVASSSNAWWELNLIFWMVSVNHD